MDERKGWLDERKGWVSPGRMPRQLLVAEILTGLAAFGAAFESLFGALCLATTGSIYMTVAGQELRLDARVDILIFGPIAVAAALACWHIARMRALPTTLFAFAVWLGVGVATGEAYPAIGSQLLIACLAPLALVAWCRADFEPGS
ncbi:MAG: hypothetical protein ABSB75_08425 [Candidatus Limnocylindrales bacterium]